MSSSLDQQFLPLLEERSRKGLLRAPLPLETLPQPLRLRVKGRETINFSSNDYLGLARHPRLMEAAATAAQRYGAGAGASPLITGQTDIHRLAIQAVRQWENVPDARLLPSGYQAAFAIIQTLSQLPEVRFLIDRLTHASLIDAVRASGLEHRVFPHNSVEKLRRLLRDAQKDQTQVVLAESIYSMDGDEAPLVEMAELKKEHPFVWVLDEAHGTGVYGPCGSGLARERGVDASVDIRLVTLSKALGLAGGAILASETFCNAVENFGRAYIYSTAISPAMAGALIEAIAVLRDEPWRAQRVRILARRVRQALGMAGESPIVPIVLKDEALAMKAAEGLLEAGFHVMAIRPPTVPLGTSRLRVTLSCGHTDQDVNGLIDALGRIHGIV